MFSVRTRIVRPPQPSSAIKASRVTLECGVEKDASVAVTWLWFVSNVEISSSDPRMSVSSADGSLTIMSVRNTDIGRYTCRVISIAGNDSAAANLDVIGTSSLYWFLFMFINSAVIKDIMVFKLCLTTFLQNWLVCMAFYGISSQSYSASPVILYPNTVNTPALITAKHFSARFTYPQGMEGWVDFSGFYLLLYSVHKTL